MQTQDSFGSPFKRLWPLGVVAFLAILVAVVAPKLSPKVNPVVTPVYAASTPKGLSSVTLAGGCFWSMEAMFKRIKGVRSAEPGYAGGSVKNPTYEQVCSGATGHAEAVNIIYDPKVVSYGQLVQVLLTVLDPTTLNQQGPDVGTNYRSAIFFKNPAEQRIAQGTIKQMDDSGFWDAPVVTEVTPFTNFYPAEQYHHNYYDTHYNLPYCRAVIVPKLEKMQHYFGKIMK
ncbi:peptide-methionine (S)-S-oxide reductase [bacterium]|nr:MAG: peptide-methionine (S)-S-oxide reductase [bacterium]